MGKREKLQGQIDPVLTELAQGTENSPFSFIASQIFPIVRSVLGHGKFPKMTREHFKLYDTKRARLAPTNLHSPNPIDGFVTFSCQERDFGYPIDYQETDGEVIDYEKHATFTVKHTLDITREKEIADALQTTGNYTSGNTASPSNKWSNISTSDPVADIRLAISTVRTNTGIPVTGMCMAMGEVAFMSLEKHPLILALLKTTDTKVVTPELIAAIFRLQAVYVGSTVYDTDAGTITDVWGDNAIVYVRMPNTSLYTPGFGYITVKPGYEKGPIIDRYPREGNKVDVVRGTVIDDVLFHGQHAGYLISDVNA